MRNSKRISVLAGGTAALIGVGVAFAAWTSTGTGTGTATAGEMGVDNVSIAGAAVSGLFPTGDEFSTVTVTNNNPYPVELDKLLFVDAVTETVGCDATRSRLRWPRAKSPMGTTSHPTEPSTTSSRLHGR